MLPSCARIAWRAMARPNPVPPGLLVIYGSQMVWIRSGGIPGPLSRTWISTASAPAIFVSSDPHLDPAPGSARVRRVEQDVRERPLQRVVVPADHDLVRLAPRPPPRYREAPSRAMHNAPSRRRRRRRAGPSGSRPNCANARDIWSRRLVSVRSTSTTSPSEGGASRSSRAIANWIGVSGFFSSCAKRRALSRNARRRSASSARDRPSASSSDIARMRCRNVSNSGAPRTGVSGGKASPCAIRSVQPTSSLSGRLSCRLR